MLPGTSGGRSALQLCPHGGSDSGAGLCLLSPPRGSPAPQPAAPPPPAPSPAAHPSALFQLAERSLLQGEIVRSPGKVFIERLLNTCIGRVVWN